MEKAAVHQRYAVVTGSNKGIGFETVRQLALEGIKVVLTSRDAKKGLEAVEKLKESSGLSHENVLFHQLDVTDPASIASLVSFIKNQFGRLDILVNNAGILGIIIDFTRAKTLDGGHPKAEDITRETFEAAEECLNTNYYGAKRMVDAFVPLLQLSDSARIVNVSSSVGLLKMEQWKVLTCYND
ncbi:hypothetical protein Ddye_030484 [Dipteronia dyeriana]|uniref:(+)-neomenthol dehydrogenase-like n=1 Tax=Dipteronia dyeriana TaxID=168575 RepID=A0AAD9TGK9_9ROSI|nr:hypothetical protein Ddye_030484 [Dipteronia dyeriana]